MCIRDRYHGGCSEEVVRKALTQRHPRSRFLLADKMPVMMLQKSSDQPRIFEQQLARCGVDYFDFYLLHSLTATHYETACRLDTFAFADVYKRQHIRRVLGQRLLVVGRSQFGVVGDAVDHGFAGNFYDHMLKHDSFLPILFELGLHGDGQAEQMDEAGGILLVVDLVFSKGGQLLAVQAVRRRGARGDDIPLVQLQLHIAGDGLLRLGDKGGRCV